MMPLGDHLELINIKRTFHVQTLDY